MTNILVLGASGMLGNAVMRLFAEAAEHRVIGTVRSARAIKKGTTTATAVPPITVKLLM